MREHEVLITPRASDPQDVDGMDLADTLDAHHAAATAVPADHRGQGGAS